MATYHIKTVFLCYFGKNTPFTDFITIWNICGPDESLWNVNFDMGKVPCNWIRFSELSTLQCHRVTDPSKSRTRSAQITVWSRSVGFLMIREHVREAKRFLSCLPAGLVDMLKQIKLTWFLYNSYPSQFISKHRHFQQLNSKCLALKEKLNILLILLLKAIISFICTLGSVTGFTYLSKSVHPSGLSRRITAITCNTYEDLDTRNM